MADVEDTSKYPEDLRRLPMKMTKQQIFSADKTAS